MDQLTILKVKELLKDIYENENTLAPPIKDSEEFKEAHKLLLNYVTNDPRDIAYDTDDTSDGERLYNEALWNTSQKFTKVKDAYTYLEKIKTTLKNNKASRDKEENAAILDNLRKEDPKFIAKLAQEEAGKEKKRLLQEKQAKRQILREKKDKAYADSKTEAQEGILRETVFRQAVILTQVLVLYGKQQQKLELELAKAQSKFYLADLSKYPEEIKANAQTQALIIAKDIAPHLSQDINPAKDIAPHLSQGINPAQIYKLIVRKQREQDLLQQFMAWYQHEQARAKKRKDKDQARPIVEAQQAHISEGKDEVRPLLLSNLSPSKTENDDRLAEQKLTPSAHFPTPPPPSSRI